MTNEGTFILLFVIASGVAILARRARVPYTVALVAAGLLLGSLHAFEPPRLTKELLFSLFLPGLLFEAAFHLEFREFWRNRGAVTALAVPGVMAAILLTAVILTPLAAGLATETGFVWRDGLVFGALIAATDPIAVVGLFRSLGAPVRLSVLVEGESLLNDGTAIVFFSLILAYAMGAAISVGGLVLQFVTVVGAGAMVGTVVGLLISEVVRRVDDAMVEITLTTIAAYGAFVVAERLHVSGVIATVVAGMFCGNYAARTGMSPSTRVAAETFWDYVAFALNSIIFLLIGFVVPVPRLLDHWVPIVAAYLAVMVGRAVVVWGMGGALRFTRERLPRAWLPALTWAGLRGGLSMVLALSLPEAFPHRDLIVTLTYGVVVLTILVNGLTMPALLKGLGVVRPFQERTRYDFARGVARAARAALDELERMGRDHEAPAELLEGLRRAYEERAGTARDTVRSLHLEQAQLREEEQVRVRRHLLLVEKQRVIEEHHAGLIGAEAYQRLLADVDARLLEVESGGDDEPAAPDTPAGSP